MCWDEKGDSKLLKNLLTGNVKGILERQWGRKKSYPMKCKQQESTYQGDRVSVGGGCEPGVTARSRCRWINVMK